MREIVAVIVAANSTVGRVAQVIDDLTAHLPPPEEPRVCPLCSTQSWPCARFDDAAPPTRHPATWFDEEQHDG